MTSRTAEFLQRWLRENIPDPAMVADPDGAALGFSTRLIEAARAEGLTADDLAQEIGKPQDFIAAAIREQASEQG